MPSRRKLNWDVATVMWALDMIGRPYVWGQTDCASLTRAMLGVIYGEPVGPAVTYHSLDSAIRAQEATGGVRAVLLGLGAVLLPHPRHAGTGDVLIAPWEAHPFDLVLPVIGDRLLHTEPEAVVDFLPWLAAPVGAVALQLPFELPG